MPRFLGELERGNTRRIRSGITFQDAVLGGQGRRGWGRGSRCCGGSESPLWQWFVLELTYNTFELSNTIPESGYSVCIVVAGEYNKEPPEVKIKGARSEEAHIK